jgi:hypothetical protein
MTVGPHAGLQPEIEHLKAKHPEQFVLVAVQLSHQTCIKLRPATSSLSTCRKVNSHRAQGTLYLTRLMKLSSVLFDLPAAAFLTARASLSACFLALSCSL